MAERSSWSLRGGLAALALAGPSAPIVQGEEAAVTATVTNQGTGPAEVVHLNVALTGGLRGSSFVAPPGAACSGTRVVTCRLGRIPDGRSATVTIRVAGVTPGTGTATATAATGGWVGCVRLRLVATPSRRQGAVAPRGARYRHPS